MICVYTYNYEDTEDVRRIREQLRRLGVTERIAYKADERPGKSASCSNGAGRLAHRVANNLRQAYIPTVHKKPEREFKVGDKIRVNLHHGRIEDAVVRAVIKHTDCVKLQIDFRVRTVSVWSETS